MSSVTVIGCVQSDVVMSPVSDLPPAGGTLLTEQMTIRVGGAGANAALASVETGMQVPADQSGDAAQAARALQVVSGSCPVARGIS